MPERDACPNCGRDKLAWITLCEGCILAKEAAYAQCRAEGVTTWPEVMAARAKALEVEAAKVSHA